MSTVGRLYSVMTASRKFVFDHLLSVNALVLSRFVFIRVQNVVDPVNVPQGTPVISVWYVVQTKGWHEKADVLTSYDLNLLREDTICLIPDAC